MVSVTTEFSHRSVVNEVPSVALGKLTSWAQNGRNGPGGDPGYANPGSPLRAGPRRWDSLRTASGSGNAQRRQRVAGLQQGLQVADHLSPTAAGTVDRSADHRGGGGCAV